MATKKKKSDHTREKIIKSALYCLAHYGDRGTTFQKIADHCGVSQPLVVKYFKNREEIFLLAWNYLIEGAREKTVQSLAKQGTPEAKLKNYLSVSLELFREQVETSRIYLLMYHLAGLEEKYKKANSEVKKIAVQRLTGLLQEGVDQGVYSIDDVPLTAKTIHNSLLGMLLNMVTEDPVTTDQRLLQALYEMIMGSIKSKNTI